VPMDHSTKRTWTATWTARPAPAITDTIEAALAKALEGATEAGWFDVVAQLASELQARRLARMCNVVALSVETHK
jgi:hypothetical protein